jgi:hypothetical protein
MAVEGGTIVSSHLGLGLGYGSKARKPPLPSMGISNSFASRHQSSALDIDLKPTDSTHARGNRLGYLIFDGWDYGGQGYIRGTGYV